MQTYIAMWSGPRNISTAMMRSFENRPDSFVSDEPFYAYYLNKTNLDHPLKDQIIKKYSTDLKKIVDYLCGQIPNMKKVWYQKHMAHHLLDFEKLDWLGNFKNCILLRDPKEVILSYSRKQKIQDINQLGFPQLFKIYKKLDYNGLTPLVIDSKDILMNPSQTLNKICSELNITFYKEMLTWPRGKRDSDGLWAKHWYANVELSTGFITYKQNINKLSEEYRNIYTECLEYYEYLYSKKVCIK